MFDYPDHPTTVVELRGARVWFLDDEQHQFRVALQLGDATYGWGGDPTLALYFRYTPEGKQFSVWQVWGEGTENRAKIGDWPPNTAPQMEMLRRLPLYHRSRFDPAKWMDEQREKRRDADIKRFVAQEVELHDMGRHALKEMVK